MHTDWTFAGTQSLPQQTCHALLRLLNRDWTTVVWGKGLANYQFNKLATDQKLSQEDKDVTMTSVPVLSFYFEVRVHRMTVHNY